MNMRGVVASVLLAGGGVLSAAEWAAGQAAAARQIEIAVDRRSAKPGETITATHAPAEGLAKSAWIGFYRGRETPAKDYLSYTFLANLTERKYDVVAPDEPGAYHFRIFADSDDTCLGASPEVLVGAAAAAPADDLPAVRPSAPAASASAPAVRGDAAVLELPAVAISDKDLPVYAPLVVPEASFPTEHPEDETTWVQPGAPWLKSATPVTVERPEDIQPAEIAPLLAIGTMADAVYLGAVSAAMEGMRLVYGPFDERQAERFNKLWAPLFNQPCDQVVIYLNKLNPLLGRYLALRAAALQAEAHLQEAMIEAGVTAVLDDPAAIEEPLAVFDALLDSAAAMRRAMAAVVKQIDALGDPPNPLECKARARKRHAEARRALRPAAPAGAWALDREWTEITWKEKDERVASNTAEFKTNTAQICSVVPKKNLSLKEDVPDFVVKWDYAWTPPPAALAGGVKLALDCRIKDAGTSYADESSPCVKIEVFSSNRVCDLVLWDGKIGKWAADRRIGGVYRSLIAETPGVGGIKKHTPQNDARTPLRWTAEGASQGNLAYHPVLLPGQDGWTATLEVKLSSAYLRASKFYRYGFNATNPAPAVAGPVSEDDAEERQRQAESEAQARAEAAAAAEDLKATLEERKQNIIALQKCLEADSREFKAVCERMEKDPDFAKRNPELPAQLAQRIIQSASNIRHEQDLVASLTGGQLVHTRTAWDEVSRQEFLRQCQEEARNADTILRIRSGVERQINLLPADQRQQHRDWARRQMQGNITDLDKAQKVAGALNEKLQGYWQGEAAAHEERAVDAEENEFYAQMIKMTSCMLLAGLSPVASAQYFGEAATITAWMPTIVGAGFGGLTGTIEGGPIEGLKQSLWASGVWGAAAADFGSGLYAGYRKRGDWKEALQEGEKSLAWGYCMGKAFQFGVGVVARSVSVVLGKRGSQPLFGQVKPPPGFTAKDAIQAAQYKQELKDARQLVRHYEEQRFLLGQYKAAMKQQVGQGRLPDVELATQIDNLEKEVFKLAASLNSSFFTKIVIKHHTGGQVSAAFRADMDAIYGKMLDRTNPKGIYNLLKDMGYDTRHIKLAAKRNGRSGASSSMDLDLALDESGPLTIIKNNKTVDLKTLQDDGQKALLEAYKSTTGYQGQRSDLFFTTTRHNESYPDDELLKSVINWDKVDPAIIPQVGRVTGVKIEHIGKDPVLNSFAKQQEQCRQAAKDVNNRVLGYLQHRAKSAGTPRDREEIQAAIEHWTKIGDRLKEIGEKTTDPLVIWEQMQRLRTQTGGGGISEIPCQIERDLRHFSGAVPAGG